MHRLLCRGSQPAMAGKWPFQALQKAQGWGTLLSIPGRYFAELRFAARSTAFSKAWGNCTRDEIFFGIKRIPPTHQSREVDGAWPWLHFGVGAQSVSSIRCITAVVNNDIF